MKCVLQNHFRSENLLMLFLFLLFSPHLIASYFKLWWVQTTESNTFAYSWTIVWYQQTIITNRCTVAVRSMEAVDLLLYISLKHILNREKLLLSITFSQFVEANMKSFQNDMSVDTKSLALRHFLDSLNDPDNPAI